MTQHAHDVQPGRARAVFATEDFRLLRAAVVHYLAEVKDGPELAKYNNLHHRLGRVAR